MANWGQLMFQDAASPVMTQLIAFHDHAMLVLTLVTSIVGYALTTLLFNKLSCRTILEAQQIETIWTILPAVTLLFLALPSLRLLYLMDEVSHPSLTIKAIGHQWYWSYEYSDFWKLEFDSYMLPTEDLKDGEFRLLEVDHRAVVPMGVETRILVTSSDVIHSWTIPALGVKADAIPGRLNQIGFTINRPGVYYGQCSEICGANHSFMPIALEAINHEAFTKWVTNSSETL
nr:cytochrome c oxidase subunit II [Abarenicola claparedi oceanica]